MSNEESELKRNRIELSLIEKIEQLEAEKAELVSEKAELLMALILANEKIDDIDMHSKNFDLIQKHAKK